MAITRAQQAKQMLQDGGMLVKPGFGGTRQGYRGPGGYQGGATNQGGAGKDSGVERGGGRDAAMGMGGKQKGGTFSQGVPGGSGGPDRSKVSQFSQFGRNVMAQNLKPERFAGIRSLASRFNPLSFILGLINPALGLASRFVTSAPDTFQTFKDSPTLADFLENIKTKKISDISVDSGRGSGLRPTIDMKKPVGPLNLNDYQGLTNLDFINRISESDMSLTPEQRQIIEDEQDNFLDNAMAGLTKKQQQMLAGPQKNLKNIMGISDEEILKNISPFNDPNDPATLEEVRNFYTAADGGMIGGGIMDAAGRQNYFLGKLVKKAKRAVKKIVKSPVGKIGLMGLATLPFGGPAAAFTKFKALSPGMKALIGGGVLSSLPLLFQQEEEQGQGLGTTGSVGGQIPDAAYTDPYGVLFSAFKAEGGSMKDEPVAKRTMPLLDMGGQEMDLRAEGGFVPIGRMEKADDVPARLSKNEFVFTADAVRNAGDGDVDKGAEVMYNMMKNLEAGGNVSEESQGLEGARNMFQTSKRLEEVI